MADTATTDVVSGFSQTETLSGFSRTHVIMKCCDPRQTPAAAQESPPFRD